MRLYRGIGLFSLAIALIISGSACTDSKPKQTTQEKPKVADSVKIGDTAPAFEMRNQDQLKISLADFKSKKNVVLVFYPADFTPV